MHTLSLFKCIFVGETLVVNTCNVCLPQQFYLTLQVSVFHFNMTITSIRICLLFGSYNLDLQAALILQYFKWFNNYTSRLAMDLLISNYIVDMAYKNYAVILFLIIGQASNFQGISIVYNN